MMLNRVISVTIDVMTNFLFGILIASVAAFLVRNFTGLGLICTALIFLVLVLPSQISFWRHAYSRHEAVIFSLIFYPLAILIAFVVDL